MAIQGDNEVKYWQERIRDGQRFQQQFAMSNDWGRYKDYYRHNNFGAGIIPVNIMFSILRSMTPQIAFRVPRVTITARKPGLLPELNARIVQKLDNWLLKELATKREFKRMVQDNFFCGIGTGFFGYDSQFGLSDKNLDQSGQFTLTQFAKDGNRIEFNSTISPGMPWFLRARPEDVVFPWGATDRESLEWVAMRIFRFVRDIRADKKYSNTDGLRGAYATTRTQPEGGAIIDINNSQAQQHPEEVAELWQVHDARTGKIFVLTMEYDKLLRKDPDPTQVDGLPVETVCFNPDPDYIYGVPDARIIEPQLLELNDIRTQAMKHRRVNILKGLVKEDAISDEEIEKLVSEDVQAIAKVKSDAASITDAYLPVNPGVSGILNDLIAQGEVVRGDVRETVGFSRTAQGEFQGKTHVSAEETKRVFQSLNIRLDERRDEMADLSSRVVRKWNQIIFTHWTTDRLAQIVGPDGAKWWLKFNGPQIKDEYDLNVESEEGIPMDSEAKRNMALEAAKVWAELNMGAIKAGMPVPAEIQRLIFNQFEDTGLDIDKLAAQTQAGMKGMMPPGMMPQPGQPGQFGQMGQSPESAMPPEMLAQLMQMGRPQ